VLGAGTTDRFGSDEQALCAVAKHVFEFLEGHAEEGETGREGDSAGMFLKARSQHRMGVLVRTQCAPYETVYSAAAVLQCTVALTCMSMRQASQVGRVVETAIATGILPGDTKVMCGSHPKTASQLAAALMARTTSAADDGDDPMSSIDLVSLGNLAWYLVRGTAKVDGELAFQQRLCPFLIGSPLCPLLNGSRDCRWFGCVLCDSRSANGV